MIKNSPDWNYHNRFISNISLEVKTLKHLIVQFIVPRRLISKLFKTFFN